MKEILRRDFLKYYAGSAAVLGVLTSLLVCALAMPGMAADSPIASATRAPACLGIVTGMRQTIIHPQFHAPSNDASFTKVKQRSVNVHVPRAFHSTLGR